MTYEEAIQFWFGRVNYEQKSPQVGDFKLERKGFTFYFPLTTSIIVSIVISIILWIFRR